ncbi:MAG TPA: SH3 domain-containing protein [Elusimicrobiota bacterium]|jgi:SH3-like domain-containing protein|nr:SH3 domain-containing protein [Elusimicrobiota bacterium]
MRRAALAGLLLAASLAAASVADRDFKSVLPTDAKVCNDADSGALCVWVREKPLATATALWKLWKFSPVEIVSYRGDWARIRDYEGDEGWLPKSVLDDTATVCVRVKEGKIRVKPDSRARVEWTLDQGYSLRVFAEKGEWYEVSDLGDVSGWIHRGSVWGAPPPPRP